MKSNNIQFHYIYITLSLIDNKYYFGKHSTSNKDDGYIGSGSLLKKSIKSLGKENFKTIMFAKFNSEDEAYNMEENIIRNFISDNFCLNKKINVYGRKSNFTTYKILKTGKNVLLHKDDPLVLKGEAVGITKGKAVYILNEKLISLDINDNRVISGEALHYSKGKKNKNLSKKLKGKKRPDLSLIKKGKTSYRLSTGEIVILDKNDPLVINKEVVGINKGKSWKKIIEFNEEEKKYIFYIFNNKIKNWTQTLKLFNEKFNKNIGMTEIKNFIINKQPF